MQPDVVGVSEEIGIVVVSEKGGSVRFMHSAGISRYRVMETVRTVVFDIAIFRS